MPKSPFLITSALPYANGPIHFGHIAGAYLPADVFTRFKKMCGYDAIHIGGTDEHGFAITVSAKKEGRSPQEHVDYYHILITQIFKKLNIKFDNFSRTSTSDHHTLAKEFFLELVNNKKVSKQDTEQLFCTQCDFFLADRYIYGICPHCDHPEARGDECENCGSWLDALEIIEPKCNVCQDTPVKRPTTHWFLNLNLFEEKLKTWVSSKKQIWKPNVINFIDSMIKGGLKPRAITRDMSWGVSVPLDDANGKVMYVWFDAPIGYISSTIEWAKKQGNPDLWESYWRNPNCQLIHFIGKDNLPFHCVVWPAILQGQNSNYILPTNVPANEFYHLEGKPFSKSRGWYIDLERFFSRYSSDSIRYAIATNAPETKDSSFSWQQFQSAHNSDLADTLGNFIHRVFVFTSKYANNQVPVRKDLSKVDQTLLNKLPSLLLDLKEYYNNFQLRKATSQIMLIAREGNKFFDEKAPWSARKINLQDCYNTLNISLVMIYNLVYAMYPILPETSGKLRVILQASLPQVIDFSVNELEVGHVLGEAQVLFTKISDEAIAEEEAFLQSQIS